MARWATDLIPPGRSAAAVVVGGFYCPPMALLAGVARHGPPPRWCRLGCARRWVGGARSARRTVGRFDLCGGVFRGLRPAVGTAPRSRARNPHRMILQWWRVPVSRRMAPPLCMAATLLDKLERMCYDEITDRMAQENSFAWTAQENRSVRRCGFFVEKVS